MTDDSIRKAAHYNAHPSGVECIDVVRHMTFNAGQVFKYLWRAGLKTTDGRASLDMAIEDHRKAQYYLADEIARLEALRDQAAADAAPLNESRGAVRPEPQPSQGAPILNPHLLAAMAVHGAAGHVDALDWAEVSDP